MESHKHNSRFSWVIAGFLQSGGLIKGTLAMTVGMGLRTLCQAGVFLIIARVLGVEAYGAYAAVLAIAGTLGSFSGLGVQVLMLREVARDSTSFASAWGLTLAAIAISAPVLLGIYLLIAWAVLPTSITWIPVSVIGVAELIFTPLAMAGFLAYQAHERIGRAARLILAPVLPRLAGALALLSFAYVLPADMRLVTWSFLHLFAAIVAAIYAVRLVHRDIGTPITPTAKGFVRYLHEGMAFALGGAALKLYIDIDKTMLARLTSLETAGAYSAGYRVADMALVPLHALFAATMPKFFRTGHSDVRDAVRFGWQIIPIPLLYTLAIGSALYLFAHWLPLLIGSNYHVAITILKWLSWLPLIALPRLMLQALLTGSDKQRIVVVVLGIGAVLNVLLNLALIPLWSWRGAVFSTYTAEITMALAFWGLVRNYQRA